MNFLRNEFFSKQNAMLSLPTLLLWLPDAFAAEAIFQGVALGFLTYEQARLLCSGRARPGWGF
jgi:hypothetical protein